jgi:hypothetical protein
VPVRHLHRSTPSQIRVLGFRLSELASITYGHYRRPRSRVMKKQRAATQAEKDFDVEVANFNKETQKILEDRRLSMNERRKLISLKGKALLRRSASSPQPGATH